MATQVPLRAKANEMLRSLHHHRAMLQAARKEMEHALSAEVPRDGSRQGGSELSGGGQSAPGAARSGDAPLPEPGAASTWAPYASG